MARKRQYDAISVRFKEDLRILYGSRAKEQVLMCLDNKLSSDRSKLLREAKDGLDNSLQHILATHLNAFPSSYFMQVNGTEAMVGPLRLARFGVYAAVHQVSLPLAVQGSHPLLGQPHLQIGQDVHIPRTKYAFTRPNFYDPPKIDPSAAKLATYLFGRAKTDDKFFNI